MKTCMGCTEKSPRWKHPGSRPDREVGARLTVEQNREARHSGGARDVWVTGFCFRTWTAPSDAHAPRTLRDWPAKGSWTDECDLLSEWTSQVVLLQTKEVTIDKRNSMHMQGSSNRSPLRCASANLNLLFSLCSSICTQRTQQQTKKVLTTLGIALWR